MPSRSYEDLIVWQKSMDLVDAMYKISTAFPDSERFGLTSQMRRAAVSIPSNIAEGSKRGGEKEFRQFILIAYGSGAELETQVQIAKRQTFGKNWAEVDVLLSEVMKMLNVLSSTFHPTKNYQLRTKNSHAAA